MGLQNDDCPLRPKRTSGQIGHGEGSGHGNSSHSGEDPFQVPPMHITSKVGHGVGGGCAASSCSGERPCFYSSCHVGRDGVLGRAGLSSDRTAYLRQLLDRKSVEEIARHEALCLEETLAELDALFAALGISGMDDLWEWWVRAHHEWRQSLTDAGLPSPCPYEQAAKRISHADKRLLDERIKEHRPAAKKYALHVTRWAAELAEEIVAEAELQAVRSWHTFDRANEFLPWYLRIVHNVCRDTTKRCGPKAEGGGENGTGPILTRWEVFDNLWACLVPQESLRAEWCFMFSTGVLRMQVFEKAGDYEAFERVLKETLEEAPMRVCAYCLMPSHWHILLWPERDGDLAGFMQRLTITHVRRWQENRHYVGLGHVYQGRYKSFPVEEDEHFLAVARYVERNALRANLVVARKSGAGRVSAGVVVELRRTRRSWPRGRWRFRKTGWSESIAPTTRASWRRYAAASSAGGRMARRNGRNGLPSVSAWNRRTARRVGRASRGGTRRPATHNGPCLLTSIANIEYRTCPVFRSFSVPGRPTPSPRLRFVCEVSWNVSSHFFVG